MMDLRRTAWIAWCKERWLQSNLRWPVFAGLLALLAGAAVFSLQGSAGLSFMVQDTERVGRGDLDRVLTATGIIKPEEGAEVKTGSRFTGVIETLHVKLGDRVAKGQPVAVLDKREQEAECRKLEAALEKTRLELRTVDETYPLLIREAEANLSSAEAELEYAEKSYERYAPLAKTRSVSGTDIDRVRQERASARQALIMRRAAKERLEAEFRLERPRLAQAINEIEAELESARIRLSYATIVSPIDGVVSGITAQEGETVVAGLQVVDLITVLDVSRLELRVYIDENDIGEVETGDLVRFRVEAYPDRQFEGVVSLIHPGPEIRNNIVYYRALVRLTPETAQALRPEMTARCEVVVDSRRDVLLVPNAAFKWVGQRRLLLRLDASGHPVTADVRTGLVGTTHTEVLQGLEDNAEVVTRITLPEEVPAAWEAM